MWEKLVNVGFSLSSCGDLKKSILSRHKGRHSAILYSEHKPAIFSLTLISIWINICIMNNEHSIYIFPMHTIMRTRLEIKSVSGLSRMKTKNQTNLTSDSTNKMIIFTIHTFFFFKHIYAFCMFSCFFCSISINRVLTDMINLTRADKRRF